MAGSYPDAPSWRMAYDRDGSAAVKVGWDGALTQLTGPQTVALNDESGLNSFQLSQGGTESGTTNSIAVCFPEPRDLDGWYFNVMRETAGGTFDSTYVVQVSPDTTNGQDGTWNTIAGPFTIDATIDIIKPEYRTAIHSETVLNIRGVRFRVTKGANVGIVVMGVHLYGEPVPGANPNRLELWHPTVNEKLPPAWLDWGNVPRNSSAERQFRVKNLSPTLTANDVRVAMEALTDGSPSVPGTHSLSYGGGSFLAQVNIGDLAPGAMSGPVTIRRITPSNGALGLWTFRLFAESTDWS